MSSAPVAWTIGSLMVVSLAAVFSKFNVPAMDYAAAGCRMLMRLIMS
jgi:hypothetical protein